MESILLQSSISKTISPVYRYHKHSKKIILIFETINPQKKNEYINNLSKTY